MGQQPKTNRGPKTPLDNKILYLLTVLLSLFFNKLPWSEISSRLVFHPDAHILFLTSTRLLEIIEASSMNKRLTKEGRRLAELNILSLKNRFEPVEQMGVRAR